MAKIKYYYDSENMEYKKIPRRTHFRSITIFLVSSFLFGLICLIILLNFPFLKTPLELSQEREISQYQSQFKILNAKMSQLEGVISNIEDRDNNIYRAFFEVAPISEDQRNEGFGGINRYKYLEGFKNSDLLINSTKRLETLQKRLVIESKSLDEISHLAKNKEEFLQSIPAIQPVKNEDLKRMASGYGVRIDPFTKIRKMHWGMDFSAPTGTPIYATGNGKVIRADSRVTGYGNHIEIKHNGGYVSLYAHLSRYNVKKGQRVKRGEIIGYVGSTGRSQGPHLHYEVRRHKKRINPINFYYGSLTPNEFHEILEQASKENQSFD